VTACDGEVFLDNRGKRGGQEGELRNRDWDRVDRDRLFFLDTEEALHIRGDTIGREIIYALIKLGVFGNFGEMGFDVVPNDILRGTGDITKEDALSRIDKELGTACSGGVNQSLLTLSQSRLRSSPSCPPRLPRLSRNASPSHVVTPRLVS
jgi:hypothetical protein